MVLSMLLCQCFESLRSEIYLCLSELCYLQDALDSFVDFDENVDSFLSNDDVDGRGMFAALEKGSSEHNTESLKGKYFNLRINVLSK
jgi:hypothetical protein